MGIGDEPKIGDFDGAFVSFDCVGSWLRVRVIRVDSLTVTLRLPLALARLVPVAVTVVVVDLESKWVDSVED